MVTTVHVCACFGCVISCQSNGEYQYCWGGGGAEGTTVYLRHPIFTYFHYNNYYVVYIDYSQKFKPFEISAFVHVHTDMHILTCMSEVTSFSVALAV